jgi:heme/copper-type cytochrome/quinol oxidase subunit 1
MTMQSLAVVRNIGRTVTIDLLDIQAYNEPIVTGHGSRMKFVTAMLVAASEWLP